MSVRLGGFSLPTGLHRGVVEKPRAILQRGSLEVGVREECVIVHVLKGSPFLLLGRERRCKDVCRFMVRHTVLIPVACFLCKGAEGRFVVVYF